MCILERCLVVELEDLALRVTSKAKKIADENIIAGITNATR